MEDERGPREFVGGDALRQASENQFGRSLNSDEWMIIDPDGWSGRPHADYGEEDLDELLHAMAQLPSPPKRSIRDPQREQALAHRQRTAAEAREFVEKQRVRLFGQESPPFQNDAAGAAKWIEEQEVPPESLLLRLKLVMPVELDDLGQLLRLRDWLNDILPKDYPQSSAQRLSALRLLLEEENSPIREFGLEAPYLEYLAPLTSSDVVFRAHVKRVRADEGTVLGDLRSAAQDLAKATQWRVLASVHHILTGGVMSSPVNATPLNRFGSESFGGPGISLQILDPLGVSDDAVAKAYVKARRLLFLPNGGLRKRARASVRRERLLAMVEETPSLKWRERWLLWNERYPLDRFANAQAMGRAFRRARFR